MTGIFRAGQSLVAGQLLPLLTNKHSMNINKSPVVMVIKFRAEIRHVFTDKSPEELR